MWRSRFTISNKPEMRIFKVKKNRIALEILKVGFSIFNLEKALKRGDLVKEVEIRLGLQSTQRANEENIPRILENLIKNILRKQIKFYMKFSDNKYKKARKVTYLKKYTSLCLFSGGIDSFVGIQLAKKRDHNLLGVFVAHSDQSGTINIVNSLIEYLQREKKIPTFTITAPAIEKGGYSQLRGFLYGVSAGALSEISQSKQIIITECGTTMYQPRFGEYDSVTHTTHPIVLQSVKSIVSTMRSKDVEYVIPFEDLTKAEIMALAEDKEMLQDTHSCISSRWRNNCGHCYGCVLRRISEVVLGIEHRYYKYDIFGNNSVNIDNLLSLLQFSYNFLFDPEDVPEYSLLKIKKYNKWNLFERQSWDVLCCLYLLKKQKYKFSKRIEKAYNIYIKDISERELQKRISIVRQGKKKPDFNKKVNFIQDI